MTGIQSLACLWALFVTQTGLCGDVQFLERREGESVVLPCGVERRNSSPFGVYLSRMWLRPGEVLFMYTRSKVSLRHDDDEGRTRVSGDPSARSLNVTISELRVGDTDRYRCEFVVEDPSSEDIRLPGKTDFFLLVSDGRCGCSRYSALLYALSSAVAVLLLLLLLGLVVVCRSKSRRSMKSHAQAPIYEEMSGLQAAGRKLAPPIPGETESSEYRNRAVMKSRHDNHYESPSGALFSSVMSSTNF